MSNGIVEEKEYESVKVGDVDWCSQGKCSRVKNQGQCGSCWAFSATGAMQSWALFKGQSVDLSQQQLVDCSKPQGNEGCNGGWPYLAFKYVIKNGITSSSSYKYIAKDQACKTQGGSFKISNYTIYRQCTGISSQIINSPLSVSVDASNWHTYKTGVLKDCRTSVNHAVLLVGITGGNWKIKNSWGTSWGENGFIRLEGTGNTCGICQYPGFYPE